MRRLLSVLFWVLFLAGAAHGRSYTANEKPLRPGWWYDPDVAGWLFTLSPAGNRLAGTLLTFDSNGEAVWYLVVGEGEGTRFTLPVTRHTWNADTNQPGAAETVGTFTFDALAPEHARASWTIAGVSGSAELEPLLLAPGYSAEDRTGHWFPDGDSGHGYTVLSQGDFLSIVHYGYDAAGQPRWVYADNGGDAARRRMDAVYFRRSCATCTASIHDAGTIEAEFSMETEGSARVDLRLPAPLAGGWQRPSQKVSLISDLPSGRVHPAALARFSSDATLADYLRAGVVAGPNYSTYGSDFCLDFSAAPPPTAAAASGTNVQEAGVDEADSIDGDGEYVYSLMPPADWNQPTRLRTHRLLPEVADLSLQSDLAFSDSDAQRRLPVDGLYLAEPGAGPRALAAVRGVSGNGFGFGFSCGGGGYGRTELELFSLADRGRPAFAHRVEIEGDLVASRRIGRTIYVVTRYTTQVAPLAGQSQPSRAVIAAATLGELVPQITLDSNAPQPLIAPESIWLPPLPPGERNPRVLTVTAIPIDNPAAFRSTSVVGDDDGIYVSNGAMYLATSRYEAGLRDGVYQYPATYFTDIHRIDLATLSYQASGTVPGTLGYIADRKPFHLSEYNGHLRVLTESSDQFGRGVRSRISVLSPDPATRLMTEIGSLPNARHPAPIGKPNEYLYAVRFVGERAYAVTFLKVDPLYVIDLSVPQDPRIVGELEMPGFSAYLHPMPDNRLLGIGLDAVSSTVTGDDGTFAWFQGLKLAVFDVSNASRPTQVAGRGIGKRGSHSALLDNHHAFAELPRTGTRNARIAFPVRVNDLMPPALPSPDPRTHYPFRYAGLATYEVAPDGTLVDRGTLVSFQAGDTSVPPIMRDAYSGESRALLVGDATYIYEGGYWVGAPWGQPETLADTLT